MALRRTLGFLASFLLSLYVRQATSFGVSSLVKPDGISLRNMGSNQVVLRPVVSSVSHKKNTRARLSNLRASVDIGAIKSKLSKSNIFLVGMDGSSKEVVGQELAKKLGYKYFNTNEIISELLKVPIDKAFEQLGEDEFLKVERAVLDQLQAYYGAVISTGSCAALQSENWAKFRTGLVVYCKMEPKLLENVGLQKPLKSEEAVFLESDASGLLDALMSQRSSFYEQADAIAVLDGANGIDGKVAQVVNALDLFMRENPAAEQPKLAEAHAQALSRIMDLGTKDETESKPAENVPQEQIESLNRLLKDDNPSN